MNKLYLQLHAVLFRLLKPIIVWVGKIHSPWSEKGAIKDWYKLVEVLKPGDVILSTTMGHLSNVFNPGKYKHAIAYIGLENGVPMIIEAIGRGVIKRPLVECISEKDEIAVIRSRDPEIQKKVNFKRGLEWINKQVGKPYDYYFDMNSYHKFSNFYCSELCYYWWKMMNPKLTFTLQKTAWVNTVIPMNFYLAKRKTEIILETYGFNSLVQAS